MKNLKAPSEIMNESFWRVFFKSFTRFTFYPDLMTWPVKRTVRYFLTVSGCLAVIAVLTQFSALILGLTEVTDWAVRKLPVLRFEKGFLKIESKKDERFVYPYGSDFVLVIDVSDQAKDEDLSRYHVGLLFMKDQMILKNRDQHRVVPYSKNMSVTVSPFTLMYWRDLLMWILPAGLGLMYFLSLVMTRGVEVVLFATLGVFWARKSIRDFPWNSSFSVAGVAITPALVLSFALSTAGIFIPYFNFIYYGVYLLVFFAGMRECVKVLLNQRMGPFSETELRS